jgi:hypothetical protein
MADKSAGLSAGGADNAEGVKELSPRVEALRNPGYSTLKCAALKERKNLTSQTVVVFERPSTLL